MICSPPGRDCSSSGVLLKESPSLSAARMPTFRKSRKVGQPVGGGAHQPCIGQPQEMVENGRMTLSSRCLNVCLDRKSTRLNSSHLGISYAVFCLKKKKKHVD